MTGPAIPHLAAVRITAHHREDGRRVLRMHEPFSLLLSVYDGDRPDYLRRAFRSAVDDQTVRPDQVVIVRDGPVRDELATCLDELCVNSPVPVTLRCTLHQSGSDDALIQYYTVDSAQKTVSSGGDIYRIGVDPNGSTGRVITRWSDTEITLVNEEWIRNGWQRFRIVTVLDRLTGAIRSEDINISYSGACTIADVAKKLF
jgi:hypothetical protein